MKNKPLFQEIRDAITRQENSRYLTVGGATFSDGKIVFNKRVFGKFPNENENKKVLCQILDMLFNNVTFFDSLKSLRIADNSIRYFSDDLFGSIPLKEFTSYNDNITSFIDLIQKTHQEGKDEELRALLQRIPIFSSIETLFNYSKGVLLFCNLNDAKNYYSLIDLIYDSMIGMNIFTSPSGIQEDNDAKIFQLLGDYNEYPFEAESILAQKILNDYHSRNINSPLYEFTISTIVNILNDNLKKIIDRSEYYDPRCLRIHNRIVSSINSQTSEVKIDATANQLMHDYILNRFPEAFIRSGIIIQHGLQYTLTYYLSQILSWDEFEKLLDAVSEDSEIAKIKSFYTQFKAANRKPIDFDFNEEDSTNSQITFDYLKGNWINNWEYTNPSKIGTQHLQITEDGKYLLDGEHKFDVRDFSYDSEKQVITFTKAGVTKEDPRTLLNSLKIVGNELIGREKILQTGYDYDIKYTRLPV